MKLNCYLNIYDFIPTGMLAIDIVSKYVFKLEKSPDKVPIKVNLNRFTFIMGKTELIMAT